MFSKEMLDRYFKEILVMEEEMEADYIKLAGLVGNPELVQIFRGLASSEKSHAAKVQQVRTLIGESPQGPGS